MGTYQKLGLLRGEDFLLLNPVRLQKQYRYNPANYSLREQPLDPAFHAEGVSYYQTASYLYHNRLYREVNAEEAQGLLKGRSSHE